MRRDHVLADVRGGDPSFLDAVLAGVFTVPGDGAVDYGALLAALKSIEYSGWLVVEAEQDPSVANPAAHPGLGFLNRDSEAHVAPRPTASRPTTVTPWSSKPIETLTPTERGAATPPSTTNSSPMAEPTVYSMWLPR